MHKIVIFLVFFSVAAYAATPSCGGIHPVASSAGLSILSTTMEINPRTAAENGVVLFGIYIPYLCNTSGIAYIVSTADNTTSNHYGFGLVCVSGCATPGQLVAQTGALTGTAVARSTGSATLRWADSSVTLEPGVYGLAVGSDCANNGCAVLYGDSDCGQFYAFIASANSTNGWAFSSQSRFSSQFTNIPAISPVTVVSGSTRLPTTPNFLLY
jgi:hypothetical protein